MISNKLSHTNGHVVRHTLVPLLIFSLILIGLASTNAANRRSKQPSELSSVSTPQAPSDLPAGVKLLTPGRIGQDLVSL